MDNRVSLDFLKKVYPEGPWCLTAIDPNKKGIETRTFHPKNEDQCLTWLGIHNGTRNIYWHVNPVLRDLTSKADREDIKEVCYFHVDVDPGEHQDILLERQRILNLFVPKEKMKDGRLPVGIPEPTAVVFSGGGYQAFWKLEKAIPIDGDIARAEDAKRYNQALELAFGADNCHNIDRLMRLPGTMNLPDAKKSKKGRVPTLSEEIWFKPERVYPVTEFRQHTGLQTDDSTAKPSTSGLEVKVSGNVRKVASLDELNEWNVDDRIKVIIVQGSHPDPDEILKKKTKGRSSRSEWLFDVCCNLVRCGVPDEMIYAIITDKDWGIAESVVELKSGAHRYAMRQIARAKEHAIDPWLKELNDKYTVVGNYGGKCRILEEVNGDGGLNRTILTKQSFEDFRNRYMNKKVQVGTDAQGNPRFSPVGKWWLEHPNRAQVDKVVFQPNRTDVPGCLNLWKGFAVEAKPGDNHASYLEHIRENICDGHEENFNYLIRWMARVVQQPASPGQVAIVLQGGRGTGKGQFCHHFGSLFGRHYIQVSNPSHLVGNFNAHLRDSLVVFSDEAFYAGDKKHNSVLKTLITEDSLTVEAKGVDVEFTDNYVHLIMASNEDHVVRTGIDERRFLILKVGEGKKQNPAYFAKIKSDMDTGGRENFLYYLQGLDLTGFEVRDVPKTNALLEQTQMSLDPKEEWWDRHLRDGNILSDHEEWHDNVPRKDLFEAFVREAQLGNRYVQAGTATAFGIWLHKRVPGLRTGWSLVEREITDSGGFTMSVKKKKERCYVFPSLDICRKAWETHLGRAIRWDEDTDD